MEEDGNGANNFSFWNFNDQQTIQLLILELLRLTNQHLNNGGDIEPIDSIKYYAPRLYSLNIEQLYQGL